LAGAGAFAVALALNVTRITHAFGWRSDLVSPMVIADTLATTHGPNHVVFGTYAPYTTIWFDVATRNLPFHRTVWQMTPLVLSLLGLGVLVWVSWRLAGRWAALTTLAIGLAWSTPVVDTMAAQANHGVTYTVVCVLAGFLMLVALRPPAPAALAALTAMVGVAGAALALPARDLTAVVWLLPAVALTLLVIALAPRVGTTLAAVVEIGLVVGTAPVDGV